MLTSSAAASFLTLLALGSALAQAQLPLQPSAPTATEAPAAVLAAFALSGGTVQDLTLPSQPGQPFQVRVVLGGRVCRLDLNLHKLRSCNFQLLIDDGKSLQAIVPPPENTYQGSVAGEARSSVAASLWNGQLQAQVHVGQETWTIQPLTDQVPAANRTSHVVYRFDQVVRPAASCGFTSRGRTGGQAGPLSGVLQSCEIALDCNYEYYTRNGSNTANTQNAATAIINGMDVVYRRDVEICYTISTIIVRTVKNYFQGPDVGCGASGLLPEMRTYWQTNHTNVQRDIAHMFSGDGPFSGTIGCAYGGVICDSAANGSGYGVSRTVSANLASNVALVAHEVGHNWSADHCDANPPCYIMCSSLGSCSGGTLQFAAYEKNQILAHKATRTCLGNCGGCNNEAGYTYFGNGCAGTGSGTGPGCVQVNWNSTSQNLYYNQNLPIAMQANTGAAARAILSVDFYCRGRSATSVTVWIYSQAGNGEPGSILGTSTMNLGTSNGVYTATFNPPVQLAANTGFFVAFGTTAQVIVPLSTSGNQVDWYAYLGSSWSKQQSDTWNYRVNCVSNNAIPFLTSSGTPRLNNSFSVALSQARSGSLAVLWFTLGASSLDLTNLGAPGCYAYVDLATLFFTQGAVANGSGNAAFAPFGVPNATGLCGAKFYQQILILDQPANTLGLVLTRRGEPVLGN